MNELILMKKDSGPKYEMPEVLGMGPTELIGGDPDAGFFGETPSTELIAGDALASMIGLTSGTSHNSTTPWLKFVLDGRILFIPKMSFRHTISWNQIQAVSAVYGDREIDVQGYRFKIRLLQGINPGESVSYNSTGLDLPITHRSEWNRLFYPICEDDVAYPKTSQIGPNWVTYPQAELNITTDDGRNTWCQETPSDNSATRVFRGYVTVTRLGRNTASTTSSNFGWRPVLELVDRILLPPEGLHYITEYVGSPRLDDWNYTD